MSETLRNIRSSFAPKPKFSFRSPNRQKSTNTTISVAGSPGGSASKDRSSTQSGMWRTDLDRSKGSHVLSVPGGIEVLEKSNEHIVLNPSVSSIKAQGSIANLRRCVVDMTKFSTSQTRLASMQANNLHTSLVVCGAIDGPAHLTGLVRSIVVLGCKQFRLHESRDVEVYLHCNSRPMIEGCKRISFAPLSDEFVRRFLFCASCSLSDITILDICNLGCPCSFSMWSAFWNRGVITD